MGSIREVDVSTLIPLVKDACGKMATEYDPPILEAIRKGKENEESERTRSVMELLLENADIAGREQTPICQDTGMVVIFAKVGQDVHFTGGSFYEALNEGVRQGYKDYYLRASVVDDPLYDRINTKDNTPAVIYTEIIEGDKVELELAAKGFGSENKSAIKMLTPADGEEGIVQFVLDTVKNAGPNACPPFVIGVGIGGTFDSCAVMAKKALLRSVDQNNPDPRYALLEEKLLKKINELGIGPQGLHGNTTALKVQIEQMPTHIAGMPCAVNMCCHVCRHAKAVL